MMINEAIADRITELQIPKGYPDINRILGEWINLGGLLIVRDLPDGSRSMDLFLPPRQEIPEIP